MKIAFWLNNPLSAINGIAIIEVEENEVADIDKMFCLVDGGNTGHFGYQAKLLTLDEKPKTHYSKRFGLQAEQQFGFPPYSEAMKHKRYYEVFVNRD